MRTVQTLCSIAVLFMASCTDATFLEETSADALGPDIATIDTAGLPDLFLADFPILDTGVDSSDEGDESDGDIGPDVSSCGVEPFDFLCPCDFNGQCDSGFCIAVTDDTVDQRCTRECDANCPEGYECKEVAGAGDPIFICVQVIDKLCDPCFSNSDCLVPGDLCVQVESATYCARDCSAASCPDGYSCNAVDGAMQCLPNSGSCACPPDVDLQNDPEHCGECGNVCTFPNAVAGCAGGDCALGDCDAGFYDLDGDPANGCEYECDKTSETDTPDPQQIDANCDGIDGDIARAIFVSPSGKDTNAGTQSKPVKTITAGIGKANTSAGIDHVYIAAGAYAERVVLADGVSLFGAFSADGKWTRSLAAYETIVQSDVPDSGGAIRAVVAEGLTVPLTVAAITIQAANNPEFGGSSYAMWVSGSGGALTIRDCRLVAGNGGPGTSAQSQPKAADGANGQPGKTTDDTDAWCNEFETYGGIGGAAGTANCGSLGAGGRGADSGCGDDNGKKGGDAPDGTLGGPKESPGTDGANGAGGTSGQGGTGGSVVDGLWMGADGLSGTNGLIGKAGGGGGSGDGHPNGLSFAIWGGGGGGGASAGCGGAGANSGTAGGGSFGLFLIDSSPDIRDCEISQKNGGNGGNGGVGGAPGQGKPGGAGGTGHKNAGDGGKGGDSGNGGAGGNGGGGAGGPSFGIALFGTSSPKCVGNTFLPLGVGGIGGIGGDLSGNAGSPGNSGILNGAPPAACDPNNQ